MMMDKAMLVTIKHSFRNPRIRIGGYVLAAAMVIFMVTLLLAWLPVSQEYHAAWKLNQNYINEAKHIEYRQQMTDVYRLNDQRLSQLESKLHNKYYNQADIVKAFSYLASASKAYITNESYSEGKISNGFLTWHTNITLEGSYPSIKQFLTGLQALDVWTVVNETKLDVLSPETNTIQASVKLVTYTREDL